MIVGLYDADYSKYIHVPFNLELMKISSYYKKKGQIVGLSTSFSPNMYNKFFYRKDFYDGEFPSEYLKSDKIEYGGRAFNIDKYIPLAPEIEIQKPDVYIYDKTKTIFGDTKKMEKAFNIMQRAEHFRLSLDGETLWNQFEKQINISSITHTLFLHDYNLNNVQDSDIIIKELMKNMSKNHRHLATKFPIQIDNSFDLFKWVAFSPSLNFFLLQYNGLMEDEALYEFIKRQRGTSIAAQMDYYVTRNCTSEDDFIKNRLPKLYKQIAFIKMEKQKVNLKYDDNFFTNKQWERLIDFFQVYLNSTYEYSQKDFERIKKYNSLYDCATRLKEKPKFKKHIFSKQDARDLFELVRLHNYECFKDFYECHTVKLVGGEFKNE